ncbi:acetate permease [Citrobacter koseri]|uniref:Acetate permease n=1 Tax=Citrobacter koseri TaxID=545 RepID=A0A2X2XIK1_CITKO|nr:acetate permease [Citrobacter koseri]
MPIILGVLFENQEYRLHGRPGVCYRGELQLPNHPASSMYWSKLTTRGAMMGGWLGLVTAVVLMVLGPTIWVQILGHEKPSSRMSIRRCSPSALPLLGSGSSPLPIILRKVIANREQFRAQFIRSQTGYGVEQGRAH